MKPFYLLKILLLVLLSVSCNNAIALYINADISSMESGQEFFSKPYINDTDKTNLYNFSAYKIDKPGNQEHGHLSITARLFLLH
ncbi:hypothetical protein [Providencia hangzhouensis]|uniref:hypothetical protein n=1 Tax=Providencia hangzhouensis TaxID=3031799 RepID=UPI0034DCCDAC